MKNKLILRFLSAACLYLIALTGCQGEGEALQCKSTADCYAGEMCRHERCVLLSQEVSDNMPGGLSTDPSRPATPLPPGPEAPQAKGSLDMNTSSEASDMGRDHEADASAREWIDQNPGHAIGEPNSADMSSSDAGVTPCEGVSPMVGELVINELLMNVPTGEQGDANADGVRDPYDDEFVEMVNISTLSLSLDGIELMVNDNVRLAFDELCLMPGQAVVVFSGPRERETAWRDDVVFMAPDSKLGLSNTAGKVELWDAADRVIFSFAYEGAQKTSYVLWPELTGDIFVPHHSISSELFSPGRCANGLALVTMCGEDDGMNGE